MFRVACMTAQRDVRDAKLDGGWGCCRRFKKTLRLRCVSLFVRTCPKTQMLGTGIRAGALRARVRTLSQVPRLASSILFIGIPRLPAAPRPISFPSGGTLRTRCTEVGTLGFVFTQTVHVVSDRLSDKLPLDGGQRGMAISRIFLQL